MKKALKYSDILYHLNEKNEIILGAHERIKGDWSRLTGDCSFIYGDVSNIYGKIFVDRNSGEYEHGFPCLCGDVTNISGCITRISGNCSLFAGNIDDCELGINNSNYQSEFYNNRISIYELLPVEIAMTIH